MLNVLTTTKTWVIASLITATSIFGQNNNMHNSNSQTDCGTNACTKPCPPKPCPKPCPQPCPPTQMCPSEPKACCPPWSTPVLNAAYNYPARIQTRCPWDMFADISFIFWQPTQENMEIGFANANTTTVDGRFINMDFNFKPGFKIGLGGYFEHDNWDLHLEYTWFHSTSHKSAAAPANGLILATFNHPASTDRWNTVSQHWNLKMDILQLDLGRWQYTGTKFTSHPYAGIRGALIRQNLHTNYAADAGNASNSSQQTKSWAIGPEMGIDTNWMICHGFRIFANAEADLTFTRYTKARLAQDLNNAPVIYARQRNINCLRTHLDFEMGLGWGTYVDCNNWYMDFALAYGFQAFFDQNMFRHYHDANSVAKSLDPNGNLYINGLTASFSLTF